ncbi:hypothetical protein [Pseudochryseolinea flava]|uniref:DoxX family protein n=1 Tax=Pseudochryseolinea flava TaxID=2059302 RepID=A0A364YAM7_9BACT|nr:hypothetical protein [Pseudochryseolinea flava]RAW02908.1 hypothetical protein DQQ10_02025 [Pseudochryseolinea flava]
MNTKILLSSSAIVVGVLGLICSFAPQELLASFGQQSVDLLPTMIQLLGAAYLSLAILNWMSKGIIIGGIYARPLALANFLHFTVGGLALAKSLTYIRTDGYVIYILTALYCVYALWFARVLFTHPLKAESKT